LTNFSTKKGWLELYAAQSGQSRLIGATFLFSIFVNLLQLAAPLYMMQVYDRVLGSRSESTLVVLSVLLVGLLLAMGILEDVRGRVLARIGAKVALTGAFFPPHWPV
jgi:ATP-binding cassette subfamily C protein